MKNVLMTVVGVAMAVVLAGSGCSRRSASNETERESAAVGSPKSVAEAFARAVIEGKVDKAVELTYHAAIKVPAEAIKDLKQDIEAMCQVEINDKKLEAKAVDEEIVVPPEDAGYVIKNGVRVTADKADVKVQFAKGKEKKAQGMDVKLQKVDGKWKVTKFSYIPGGLETM